MTSWAINPNTGLEWRWVEVVAQLVGDEIVKDNTEAERIADWMQDVGLLDD